MPLIETQSFTNQAINAGKTIAFAAVPINYEQVNLRVFLYDLAAVSSAKTVVCQITKSGSGILSRLILTPTITTASTSVVLSTDLFTLGAGDVMTIIVTGGATDTANVDIVAELWGIPDLSAAIANLPTAAEIDTQLSGTHGAGSWGNGSGSTSTTVTVNDGVNPIDGVDVWISTDSAGTNVIARGSTGALKAEEVLPVQIEKPVVEKKARK